MRAVCLPVGSHWRSMYFGNVCQTGLPSLARPGTMGGPQPSPDPKPRLPFRLLPSFSEMDLHKALIGPGFRLATPLKRKSSSCGVCRLRFNSEVQASSHYGGTKHAKRIKALDTPPAAPPVVDAVSNGPETLLRSKDTASPPLPLLSPPPAPPASSVTPDTTSAGVEASTAAEAPPPPASEPCTPSGGGRGLLAVESAQSGGSGDASLPPSPGTERERERLRTTGGGEAAEEEQPEAPETTESEEEKARRLLYCSLCKVAVNSASQLQAHNSGTKHKTMLEARSGDGAIKSFPRSGVKAKLADAAADAPPEASTGLQNKTFHCEICDVHVNSETQLKQHISSRRHKDRAVGKPAKPKFSPYATPPQRLQSLQAVRLALRKDQDVTIKPLSASCLLQRHLAAAAAITSLSHPFHLRPASGAGCPALFHHTQPLPQAAALLQHHHHHHPPPPNTAATQICSPAHHHHTSPILFSPY